jgi:hypothetical protein
LDYGLISRCTPVMNGLCSLSLVFDLFLSHSCLLAPDATCVSSRVENATQHNLLNVGQNEQRADTEDPCDDNVDDGDGHREDGGKGPVPGVGERQCGLVLGDGLAQGVACSGVGCRGRVN